MKPTNKIIIYDDACPMCSAYTKAFVSTGFLTADGRESFSNISAELIGKIDTHKCRNEIPLINTSNNTIKYGIDALLDILGDKIPVIKTIGNLKPVNWLLKKLYNVISYNRRVITAGKTGNSNFDCTPDFNVKYRILFLCLGLALNTFMLIPEFTFILSKSFFSNTSILKLQAAHFAFVLVNITLAITLYRKKGIEFLGQANMLAMLTTLLLLPLCFLNYKLHLPALINNSYLAILFVFIISEYRRRMKFAGMLHHKYVIVSNTISVILFLLYLLI